MSTALPTPRSLRSAAEAAATRGEPLVVMTSLAGCPWCDMVRDHHLGPMLRKDEVVAVQIDIRDRQTPLQNFEGQISTASEQARLWKARFAPRCCSWARKAKNWPSGWWAWPCLSFTPATCRPGWRKRAAAWPGVDSWRSVSAGPRTPFAKARCPCPPGPDGSCVLPRLSRGKAHQGFSGSRNAAGWRRRP